MPFSRFSGMIKIRNPAQPLPNPIFSVDRNRGDDGKKLAKTSPKKLSFNWKLKINFTKCRHQIREHIIWLYTIKLVAVQSKFWLFDYKWLLGKSLDNAIWSWRSSLQLASAFSSSWLKLAASTFMYRSILITSSWIDLNRMYWGKLTCNWH